ncbi:MAG: hypothetical protein G01um101456_405, partial [Parcubacteria group bacterium Gr01-1014_56]
MRDMVLKGQHSIRDIPVPAHVKRREPTIREPAPSELEEEYMDRPINIPRPKSRRRRWFLISAVVVVLVCAIGGLLLSTLFAGATI